MTNCIRLKCSTNCFWRRKSVSRRKSTILEGDSAGALPFILSKLKAPAVFWLDAHASGGETARGAIETPIESELAAILNHPIKTHVILIDDAREFGMGKDYPTLKRVQKQVAGTYQNFEVKDDIIRITT